MNNKFFALPQDKQKAIINSAYRVFSHNDYSKAPMSEIAASAGISKSLLFHYFENKLSLYMYLWKLGMKLTSDETKKFKVTDTDDLFEMLSRANRAKCSLMRSHPYIYQFTLKAYYEENPAVKEHIQKIYAKAEKSSEMTVLSMINTDSLRPGIDLIYIYRLMVYAVEGYMNECFRSGNVDPDKIENDIEKMIVHWRIIYGKENEDDPQDLPQ